MTSPLAIQLRKEFRALFPWAAAVGLAAVALAFWAERESGFPNFRNDLVIWLVIVHVAGVLTIAALAIGQELTHGTLAVLLVHPVSRRRLLATKLLVASGVLFLLAVIAEVSYPALGPLRRSSARLLLIWGPAIVGIGLVPVLTLLTRRPIGGVAFATVVPWTIFGVAQHYFPLATGTFALNLVNLGTLVACGLGLVTMFLVFSRLEIAGTESGPSHTRRVAPAVAAARTPPRRRHWAVTTGLKELKLQRLTLTLSGLYVLASVAVMVAQQNPGYVGPSFDAVSWVHSFFIAIIAGAVASADERHLGTLTAEALHPVASSRRWAIKSGVTISLAVVLAIGLPRGLMVGHRPAEALVVEQEYVAGTILTAVAALYVSSLSSNSLWALLACFPALGGALAIYVTVMHDAIVNWRAHFSWWGTYQNVNVTPAMRASYRDPGWAALGQSIRAVRAIEDYALVAAVAGLILLVLYLARRNHDSLDTSRRVVIRQFMAMAAAAVGVVLIVVAASHLAFAFHF